MPKKIEAPDYFERHPENPNLLRCKYCTDGDYSGLGVWIQHGSWKGHVGRPTHQNEVIRFKERERRKEEEKKRIDEIRRNGGTSRLENSAKPVAPQMRANMFEPAVNECVGDTGMDPDQPGLWTEPPARQRVHWLNKEPAVDLGIQPLTVPDPAAERERLQRQVLQLLEQAQHEDEFGKGDDSDDITATNIEDAFAGLGLNNEPEDEEIFDYFNSVAPDKDYYPYPNKVMMLLDILDNLPRLRMSSNQLKLIFWLLNECGVSNVPSYSSFRNMQTRLRKTCGSTPEQHVSSLGNIFYSNDIGQSIVRDFANPEIAKHLHFYPEETEGPISEVWQAGRWKEFKPSELTPMFSRGHRQFFIEEVAQLRDGRFVIPQNLITRKGRLTSDCKIATPSQTGWTLSSATQVICTDDFEFNYYDVISRIGGPIPWCDGIAVPEMPNELRKLAGPDDLVVIMLPLWCDDVSGNKSKQYNKHINICTANSNIPGRLLQQEYFVHFVSTSPNATSPEQFSELKKKIEDTHKNPLRCYNAHTKRNTRAIIRASGFPADNPQQSEEASHIGGNGNCKCRGCRVGGNHKHTESDEGYHELYTVGLKRSVTEVKEEVEEQIRLATYGIEKPILDRQTQTGTKDKVAQYWIDILLQKAREMKSNNPSRSAEEIAKELQEWLKEQPGDKINPLLSLAGIDPTQDTPVEILHTILLGIVKYAWYNLHSNWTEMQQNLFTIRLQSTDISGLSVPPIRAAYMMQYRNALIGKHFKTLMQTMPFHVHGAVSEAQFQLVKAIGEFGSVLWVHEIDNMDQYLSDLEILIGNVLDAFAAVDPSKIIVKMKLHMLPHLIDDVRRYGPAIRNSTEVFECFNAIFRLCSVLSNHQAPSRDIALKFASMDRLKHMLSGGYWLSEVDENKFEWVQAGENVRQVLRSDKTIQRHLGWAPAQQFQAGIIRFEGLERKPAVKWEKTETSKYLEDTTRLDYPEAQKHLWRKGVSVTAQSGDHCAVGSWVVAQETEHKFHIGRIQEIIGPTSEKNKTSLGLVLLERFELGKERHPEFNLPTLRRPSGDNAQTLVVKSHAVLFIFSAQHDCRTSDCQATALRPQLQEREATTRMNKLIAHQDDNYFIVNLYGLHNANLLRRFLPRELTRPIPLHEDRKAYHFEVAAKLRVQQDDKREKTKAKRAATAAAKKAKQVAHPSKAPSLEPESEEEMVDATEGMLDSGGEREDREEAVSVPVRKRRRAN